MQTNRAVLALTGVLVIVIVLLAACGGPGTDQPPVEPLQEEPTTTPPQEELPTDTATERSQEEPPTAPATTSDGTALLQERCATCHGLERVTQVQKSREQWEQTVGRMVGKGAQLSAEEQAALIDYLAETFAP